MVAMTEKQDRMEFFSRVILILINLKIVKGNDDILEFEDGKWVLSVYVTNADKSADSIYLMRQLNVALNRDINKLKELFFLK